MIPLEYLNLTCRSIDLALPPEGGPPPEALIRQVAGELTSASGDEMVALRGPHRWVQTYVPLRVPDPGARATPLRPRGVYLITGGLGGIGLGMAEYLAEQVQARLVLVGRSALPPRAEWAELVATQGTEQGMGRRVHRVQALEARGSEVLVLQADVADEAQMRQAVERGVAQFGAVHGVLHAAGVPGVGLMQLKAPETAAAVLRPKVQGTLAIARAVADLPLDFLVLFSSVTSANGGGPGQVDYCAANAFMDAYARSHATTHGRTVSISWGEWLWDAWQEGLLGYPEVARAELIRNRQTYGLSFAEGAEALRRVLSCQVAHVFVTTRDLGAMVEDMKNATARSRCRATRSSARRSRCILGQCWGQPISRRGTSWRNASRRSGGRCWGSRRSASATTSSSWGATPCSESG